MLYAYLDAANLHDDQAHPRDVMCVAGFVAPEARWKEWEEKWIPFLERHQLARWHQTEYDAKKKKVKLPSGKFAEEQWKFAEWLAAGREACDIINDVAPVGLGYGVVHSEYREVRRTKWPSLPENPYRFCLDRCLEQLIHHIGEAPIDEGISIICDWSHQEESLGQEIAKWHEAQAAVADSEQQGRRVTTAYGNNYQFRPLQAADIIAFEGLKACELQRSGRSQKQSIADRKMLSWLIEGQSLLNLFIYDAKLLEWEIESMRRRKSR